MSKEVAWKCSVCGYVHRDLTPPDSCPVCGADADKFERYAGDTQPDTTPAGGVWQCLNCNHVHHGAAPPEICPLCGVPADRFQLVANEAYGRGRAGENCKIVVLGAGIAGISAVESIRQAAPDVEIVLISNEKQIPYYRLNLTRLLAGEVAMDSLSIHEQDWYDENGIELMMGACVSELDVDEKTLVLDDGSRVSFDKLILAMGAHSFLPPLPGITREGVLSLRTLDDASKILEQVADGQACVCVGGGVLGLEVAGALAKQGANVTLLESHEWLMPRQLNRQAGNIVKGELASMGIKVLTEVSSKEIVGDERVAGVCLQDDSIISGDLVIVSTGVRPNSWLARSAGLTVNRGIVVDHHLETSSPDIFAAGDVAEHNGVLYGSWAASLYQGAIAGLNSVGLLTDFGGIPRSHTIKILAIELMSIGEFEAKDGSYQVIEQEADGNYSRFVFRDGLMVGSILLGDATLAPEVKHAIESRVDFSKALSGHVTFDEFTVLLSTHN